MDRFEKELLIFVVSLLRWIEVFALTIELLMFANAVLNEELSNASDPTVFETLDTDKLMTTIELKIDVHHLKSNYCINLTHSCNKHSNNHESL